MFQSLSHSENYCGYIKSFSRAFSTQISLINGLFIGLVQKWCIEGSNEVRILCNVLYVHS